MRSSTSTASCGPGEPPTLETAEALFNGLFFDSERYDLSAVGRVKMNSRLSLETADTVRVLRKEDILAILKVLVELKDGRGEIDDIDHLGNRRVRSVGELMENQYRVGLAAHGAGDPRAHELGRDRHGDAARPHQRQAGGGGGARVLRLLAALAVHGPDQPALRDHPQAAALGAGPGRPDARARRASRCATCIRRITAASARSRRRKARISASSTASRPMRGSTSTASSRAPIAASSTAR